MKIAILTKQIGHYHHARYRTLAERGANITIVSSANEGKFSEFSALEEARYPVVKLCNGMDAYRTAIAEGRLGSLLNEALDKLEPNAIAIAGWASPESFAAIRWANRNRRQIIVMSDSQEQDAARSKPREFVKSRIVHYCDSALVAGSRHADYIGSLGMPADRTRMGYDVVDNAYFSGAADDARRDAESLRKHHGLPDRYLFAVSRFIEKKNLARLIAAYGAARHEDAGIPDLLILGDGELRNDLEELITSLGLDGKVHLPGFRAYDALPAYYALAEGFIHVPMTEQWGLVINEAAASGLPLIVSKTCGAAPELVENGVNGFTIAPDDDAEIAQAIIKLANLDDEARQRMAQESQRIVSAWDTERFATSLIELASLGRRQTGRINIIDSMLMSYLSGKIIETVS